MQGISLMAGVQQFMGTGTGEMLFFQANRKTTIRESVKLLNFGN